MTDRFQWCIYQANLNPTRGSEQAGRRPVLVISRESVNAALLIVGVLPLTSHKSGRRIYPTEVFLEAGTAGLPVDSIVLAHQVRTLAKLRLEKCYGTIDDPSLQARVRLAISLFLDLGG